MKIEALFKDMHYEEFDSANLVASDPWHGLGVNVLTEMNLYLDGLGKDGVILTINWYHGRGDEQDTEDVHGHQIPVAARRTGCAILLVSPDEIDDLVWLKKDGEKILWREGNELINGEKFFAMEQLCFSDGQCSSISTRAAAIFRYLENAYPNADKNVIAESMGYTLPAIERIFAAQGANGCDDEEGEEGDE